MARESEELTVENDKKMNVEYWDEIDEICERFIKEYAKQSTVEITGTKKFEDYVTGIAAEVRDSVRAELEKHFGAKFPIVEGEY